MDDLLAATLHDAKNGLNALAVWLDQAKKSAPSPALAQAQQQLDRLNTQLVELLALYRNEKALLRLNIADHDLADFWDDLKNEWVSPPDTAITLRWPTDNPVPVWAFDAYQVKLVLFDALRNALRHAVTHIHIRVVAEPDGGIRFTVADDGPGFPDHHETKGMDEQGSGLGLAFARLIAEHHRTPNGKSGWIEMKNAPTSGALFSLILP